MSDTATDTSTLRIWPTDDSAFLGGQSSVAEVARLRADSNADDLNSSAPFFPIASGIISGDGFQSQFFGFGSQSILGDVGSGAAGAVGRTVLSVASGSGSDVSSLAALLAGVQSPLHQGHGSAAVESGSHSSTAPQFSAQGQGLGNGHGHHGAGIGADPLWVLDANNAIVLSPAVADNQFSTQAMDLRAQVSGSTVISYSWDLSQAPDATNVSGAGTYRLQFNWADFSGAARTDAITLNVTTSGGQMSETLTFNVTAHDSPAWGATPPTSANSWGHVLAPDQLRNPVSSRNRVSGHNYDLRLEDGAALTRHSLPTYNPGVPALSLLYSSTAADTRPIFSDHYQLDPTQAVPTRVSAHLTLNGVAGDTVWYDTSLLNPGDIMQIALQADATGLATGRYGYSIAITAHYDTPVTTTDGGTISVINPASSFVGPGWSLDDYYRLWSVSGGAILEAPGGLSLWFANGQQAGTFVSPAGDFSTLVQNQDGTYRRTLTDGTKYNFSAAGLETARLETNGDTFTYGYTNNQLTSITDFDGLVTSFGYTNGMVSSITDPAGRVTQLGRNASGQLTTITDPDSALWQYGYDSSSHLTSLLDPLLHPTSFSYNFAGRVASVTRPDSTTEQLTAVQMQGLTHPPLGTQGNPAAPTLAVQASANYTDPRTNVWQSYTDWLGFGLVAQDSNPVGDMAVSQHDANGLAWLVADPLARRERDFFDSSGNPTKIVNADDTYSLYVYNSFSEATQYTDPRGYVTNMTYNGLGEMTLLVDAAQGNWSWAYNAHGFVTSATDALNRVTSFTLDSHDRVILKTNPDNSTVGYSWDNASNLASTTSERGYVWLFQHDAMGRTTGETLPNADPNVHPQWTWTFDAAGNLTAETNPLNNAVSFGYDSMDRMATRTDALNHTVSWGHDANGNVTSFTDALNRTWVYAFDPANRQTSETDPLFHTWQVAYDAAGETVSDTDPLNHSNTYTWNFRGWLASWTNPIATTWNYAYDQNGNLTFEEATGFGINNGPQLHYTFDVLNQKTSFTDPLAHTWSWAHDAVGNVISATDPLSHTTTYVYSNRDWMTSATDPLNHTVSWAHDAAGNVTGFTDGLNRTTSYSFDPVNQMGSQTDANGGVTSRAYDVAGQTVSLTDPDSNVTSWAHDAAGRVTSETDPLGRTTYYVRTNADELSRITDRDGRVRQFVRDNAGRLTEEDWLDSQNNIIRAMNYGWNNANYLVSASDPDSAYSFTYNAANWVTSVDNQGTANVPHVVLNYVYEPLGHRVTMSDNLGWQVNYDYDLAARLTNLSLQQSGQLTSMNVTFNYDNANRPTFISRTAGSLTGATINTNFTWDNADRLTQIQHVQYPSTVLATFHYSYDAADQLTQYTGAEGTLNYGYDNDGQLTSVSGAHSESYSFDANGNRTMPGYQTGAGNRLLSDGTYNYSWDNEGNLIRKTRISDGQTWNFTWDYRNRLTDVVIKDSAGNVLASQHNTYDLFDRRIGVYANNGGTTSQLWTVYDGANAYLDFNGSGSLTVRYLPGLEMDERYGMMDASSNRHWYLTDMLGSVRLVVSGGGTVLDQLAYDSFGNITTETNSANGDRFKFAGREWDALTGMYFDRARELDPYTGRFINTDPLAFAGGDSNLYRYVKNIPVTEVDSAGLEGQDKKKWPNADPGAYQGALDLINADDNLAKVLADACDANGLQDIKFKYTDDVPEASWNEKDTIALNPANLPNDSEILAGIILFELLRAKYQKKQGDLNNQAKQKQLGRNEYAEASEGLTYDLAVEHSKLTINRRSSIVTARIVTLTKRDYIDDSNSGRPREIGGKKYPPHRDHYLDKWDELTGAKK